MKANARKPKVTPRKNKPVQSPMSRPAVVEAGSSGSERSIPYYLRAGIVAHPPALDAATPQDAESFSSDLVFEAEEYSREAPVMAKNKQKQEVVLPSSIGEFGRKFMYIEEEFYEYIYDDQARTVKGRRPKWNGERVIGKLTVGYGHTKKGAGKFVFKKGNKVDKKEAVAIFNDDIAEHVKRLHRYVRVDLNQDQFDALLSRFFNMGFAGGNGDKITDHLNGGDYEKVGELLRGNGRREREAKLWNGVHETMTDYEDAKKEAAKAALEAERNKRAAQKGKSAPNSKSEGKAK